MLQPEQLEGRVIRGVDCSSNGFRKSFSRIKDPVIRKEVLAILQDFLFLLLDRAPAHLHLHQLTQKRVASGEGPHVKCTPWTMHVTRNDAYKASFTLEGGVAIMRVCGTHAEVDKRP